MESLSVDYLEEQSDGMFELLKNLVLIQSSTHNKPGVNRVCDAVLKAVEDLPLRITRLENENYGDTLILSSHSAGESGNILLVGHLDTVFPEDTDFKFFRDDEKNVYGPGVIDMKGGIVAVIYALKALNSCNMLSKIPIRVIFNTDEEIGSPSSRDIITSEAKKSAMALVTECGGMNGEVVTGRKGRLGLEVHVKGKAGHAANLTEEKSSAVLALAHKIIEIESLNNTFPELTVNVGRIEGGTGPNSIAETAMAAIDIRFTTEAVLSSFMISLEEISDRIDVAGTTSRLVKVADRPAMVTTEQNRELFFIAAEAGERLDIPVVEEFRSGGSDANIIAAAGTPVIDGLGPIGLHDHSDREYMIKKSLPDRTKLLVLLIELSHQRLLSGKLFKKSI
ncbi:MAG: M20 family metallopeptidase [Anaerolineales bacterium]|nr:M20 family metallopeptidase [Anaerolineales bacterium]